MPDFDNYSDLFSYIDNQVNQAIVEISATFYKVMRDFVITQFYDVYNPEFYERTYDVYNSITLDVNYNAFGGYYVDIFFDPDKIHPRPSTYSLPYGMPRYNHHMTMDGEITSYEIVNILNEGYSFGKGKTREAGRFLEATRDYLLEKRNWLPQFRRILKEKGLEAIVTMQ